jgi:periplasmic divalent cation tolerance protein
VSEVLTVLCTCPDTATAKSLATGLVQKGLAACVNVLPEIRSIYRWGDEIHDEGEVLLLAKTSRRAYGSLESWLLEHHPYEVPEVLALPVQAGATDYLDWVLSEVENR